MPTSTDSGSAEADCVNRGLAWDRDGVEIVPVRRDGTGRLVAVGLIEVRDLTGVDRWSLISGSQLPNETLPTVIERCLTETLGPDVRGQYSESGIEGAGRELRRADPRRLLHSQGPGEETPTAVEITGRLAPHGVAMRFTWFLVTALPAQDAIRPEHRALLAAFLEAQGEPGLAGRLTQFSR
jgi:Domain of unknown function (DUF4916)